MRQGRTILFVLILVTAFISLHTGAPAEDGIDPADKQFGFADALFQEGDYFRAITEYKRFIFLYPGDKRVDRAALRITECYVRAKRFQEAVDSVRTFAAAFPASPLIPDAVYLKALAQKNQKKYDEALETLNALVQATTGEMHDRAVYQQGLVALEKADWKSARNFFSHIPPASSLSPSARDLTLSLESADHLPEKDPDVAGALAAVLPGAGHLYTDRPRDAAVAFLLNAAFIAAAVQLFHNDDTIAGGIVTFFELGWYTGNIYSAVGSAHKYNERVRTEYIQRLKENSAISLHERNAPGIMFKYSFNF